MFTRSGANRGLVTVWEREGFGRESRIQQREKILELRQNLSPHAGFNLACETVNLREPWIMIEDSYSKRWDA